MEGTDRELLARYRAGQVEALETLVERYKRALFAFIFNMTGGRDEADEVFQEVWFRAIRKLDGYKEGSFSGWLVKIARNIVIDRARRKKPVLSLDADRGDGRTLGESVAGQGGNPADLIEAAELGRRIAAAVADLPDDQREVFLMRTRMDLPFREVARIQKVSINTALARMQYALAKLRPVLADDYQRLAGT